MKIPQLCVILSLVLLSADLPAQSTGRAARLVDQAEAALDSGQHVEAIELLIRAQALGSRAATHRLQEIEAAMALLPSDEWLDASGNQIRGSLRDFEVAEGLDPGVLATINLGVGRAVVADLPIVFEVVQGTAQLVSPVATTDYGIANSKILQVEDPYSTLVVRARVAFSVEGESVAFGSVARDFAYRPMGRSAALLTVLVDGESTGYRPRTGDRVAEILGARGIDFVAPKRLPSPEALLGSRAGPAAADGGAAEAVYVLVVLTVDEAAQVTLGDRRFDIWRAEVSSSYQVLRQDDRRLLRVVDGSRAEGQASNRQGAVNDAIERAMILLVESVEADPNTYTW